VAAKTGGSFDRSHSYRLFGIDFLTAAIEVSHFPLNNINYKVQN